MSRATLTPGKALLLMLGVGTTALMGLPGVVASPPPTGSLSGSVVDEHGAGVAGCRVALFQGDALALMEWTSSDARGRFAFQECPEAFHVFAAPSPESGLVGTWSLARESARAGELELVVRRGTTIDVLVRDEAGRPLAGAEVRAYDPRGKTVVVARVTTDDAGRAQLLAPRETHVGVLGTALGHLSAWAFDLELGSAVEQLEFTLPAARRACGEVRDEAGEPLTDVLVSSWDEREDGWHWNGYALSGGDGAFCLPASRGTTWLRAVDRGQEWLPAQLALDRADAAGTVALVLQRGLPLEVRCGRAEEASSPAGSTGSEASSPDGRAWRVWVWGGPESGWGWGARTREGGRVVTSVAERHGIVVEPLSSGASGEASTGGETGAPLGWGAWDRTYGDPVLELD